MDSLFAPLFDRPSWLVSLGILAGGALLCLFLTLRLRQLNARLSTRLNERMAEQERVARELHDALLQSMQGLVRLEKIREWSQQDGINVILALGALIEPAAVIEKQALAFV